MTGTTRVRRECREPHTLFDSTCLEAHTSPRLNDLTHHGRQGENADTTASTVLNRFSSVSPQQAGVSSDSIGGYFFPPPPPPPPPCFFNGAAAATNPFGVEWPIPIPSSAWARPQDVPWIPPPPIPLNHPSAGCTTTKKNAAATRWPTPQDIPLPSTFPFPPYLLPPFPPLSPGIDFGQMPPLPQPPPWFPLPPGNQREQQQQQHEEEEEEEEEEDEESDDEDGDDASEPAPRQWHRAMPRPIIRTRQPSISAQEQQHMRSIASKARRQLQRGVSCGSGGGERRWRTSRDASPSCSVPGRGARAVATSARRFSSPSETRYPAGTSSRPATAATSKGTLERRRDYYTEARALKGVAPRLGDAIEGRLAPRKMGEANLPACNKWRQGRQQHQRPKSSTGGGGSGGSNNNNVNQPSAVGVVGGYQEAVKRDERVAEYLKGIEDLYQRLRSSYEEFQRDPSSFMKSASELKEVAVSKAPPVHTLLDEVDVVKKKYNGHEAGQGKFAGKEFISPSEESQRLKAELLKLEMQWQRLEELKQDSTGERGAAPVEFLPDSVIASRSRQRNGEKGMGGSAPSGARGRVAAMDDLLLAADVQRASSLAGMTNGRTTSGAASRVSTPSSIINRRRDRSPMDGVVAHRCQTANGTTSNGGPFTREHVLGLVRERKAILE